MIETEVMNPKERAEELLAALKSHADQKNALIAELLRNRDEINEALAVLTGVPIAKPKGRPAGSRNRAPRKSRITNTTLDKALNDLANKPNGAAGIEGGK